MLKLVKVIPFEDAYFINKEAFKEQVSNVVRAIEGTFKVKCNVDNLNVEEPFRSSLFIYKRHHFLYVVVIHHCESSRKSVVYVIEDGKECKVFVAGLKGTFLRKKRSELFLLTEEGPMRLLKVGRRPLKVEREYHASGLISEEGKVYLVFEDSVHEVAIPYDVFMSTLVQKRFNFNASVKALVPRVEYCECASLIDFCIDYGDACFFTLPKEYRGISYVIALNDALKALHNKGA